MSDLTHFDESGQARMVDVGPKPVTDRRAVASGRIHMRRLNGKIEKINRDITIFNEPLPEKKAEEKKGLMGTIKKIFG